MGCFKSRGNSTDPLDESTDARESRLRLEAAALARSKQLDAQLMKERRRTSTRTGTVLLLGASGVGKSTIARHARLARDSRSIELERPIWGLIIVRDLRPSLLTLSQWLKLVVTARLALEAIERAHKAIRLNRFSDYADVEALRRQRLAPLLDLEGDLCARLGIAAATQTPLSPSTLLGIDGDGWTPDSPPSTPRDSTIPCIVPHLLRDNSYKKTPTPVDPGSVIGKYRDEIEDLVREARSLGAKLNLDDSAE